MPPYIKGGTWSNVEDEVLKAGIAKYGLNQWGRVSTLLNNKTAKQCKSRWKEYLDPTLKKGEWSREEDEKLLSMAKMMPEQWRSIAEIVGRTATGCLERYQKLLEDADSRVSGLNLTSSDQSSSQSVMNPESKPARPDAVDMDEDEKEMLAEARARLSNTQGKKAKRRERERLLEQTHRMSILQKKRELKQQGVNIDSKKKLKQGEIDYSKEIPYQKKPVKGLYDTTEELHQNELEKDKYDKMVETKGLQLGERPDKKRRKDEKNDSAAQQAAEARAEKLAQIDVAEQQAKRRKLELPAPKSEYAASISSVSKSANDDDLYQKMKDIQTLTQAQSTLLGEEEEELYDQNFEVKEQQKQQPEPVVAEQLELPKPKKSLRSMFAALPKPKNDYELVLPEEKEEEEEDSIRKSDVVVKDQDERDRELELLRKIEEQNTLLRRSQAIQRGLDIPDKIEKIYRTEHTKIEDMIADEMNELLISDHVQHKGATGRIVNDLGDQIRTAVNKEIEKELQIGKDVELTKVQLPGLYDNDANVGDHLVNALSNAASRSNKIEEKLKVVFGGYSKRQNTLKAKLDSQYDELLDLTFKHKVYSELQSTENIAIHNRTVALQEEVDFLVDHERASQERYKYLQSLC